MPNAEQLELDSIDRYVNFVGKLSTQTIDNKPLRSFTIHGLPIYWITGISVRHDSFHWGQAVFLLLTAIDNFKDRLDFKENRLLLLIDGNTLNAKSIILNYLDKNGIDVSKVQFILNEKPVIPSSKRTRINVWSQLKNLLKPKMRLGLKENEESPLFLGVREEAKLDNDLIHTYEKFASARKHPQYLKLVPHESVRFMSNSFEAIIGIFKVLRATTKLKKELSAISNSSLLVDGIQLDSDLVINEMIEGLEEFHHVFMHYALSRWLGKIKDPLSVFFADEFYKYGRVISQALINSKNSGFKSFGVQHGLLLRTHTVYTITDHELNGENALPIPSKFIVWGGYFKELFLSRNSLSGDYVVPAGNLKYINLKKSVQQVDVDNQAVNILWCTTLWYNFLFEYGCSKDTLKKMLETKSVKITFRLHPGGHIKEQQIREFVDKDLLGHIHFDNHTALENQMLSHQWVFSSVYSSIFIDALVLGCDVIRFISAVALADFKELNLHKLHDVQEESDFSKLFDSELAGPDFSSTATDDRIGNLLHLKDDVWNDIVEDTKA